MTGVIQAPAQAPAADGTDVLLRHEGRLARLTLNRPQAINALTLEMVRQLNLALDAIEQDDRIDVVLLDGAGDRGLCAGGDIVALYDAARAGTDAARQFWTEEYALNARIARYPKPFVVIMDGIVMGGGIGLAGHARHRLATERLMAAMPEVGIGFTPDVGGSWLLSRSPGELGTHLALTAGRAGAEDAVLVGLADAVMPLDAAERLRAGLATGDVDSALATATAEPPADLPTGRLASARAWIDDCYAGDDAEQIVQRLAAHDDEAAQAAAVAIRRASPTSVKVTLRALRQAAALGSLEEALAQELIVSCGFLRAADFVEGVRAQVIDKDRKPSWQPAALEQVTEAAVDAFFGSSVASISPAQGASA